MKKGCFLKSESLILTAQAWVWSCCLYCVSHGLCWASASSLQGHLRLLHLTSAPISKAFGLSSILGLQRLFVIQSSWSVHLLGDPILSDNVEN